MARCRAYGAEPGSTYLVWRVRARGLREAEQSQRPRDLSLDGDGGRDGDREGSRPVVLIGAAQRSGFARAGQASGARGYGTVTSVAST